MQRAGVVRGRRRLRASRKEFEAGALDAESLRARVAAWRGHALHASNQDFAERVLLEEGCAHLSSAVS